MKWNVKEEDEKSHVAKAFDMLISSPIDYAHGVSRKKLKDPNTTMAVSVEWSSQLGCRPAGSYDVIRLVESCLLSGISLINTQLILDVTVA